MPDTVKVLNLERSADGSVVGPSTADVLTISQLLQKSMLRLTGKFFDEAAGTVNYKALRDSHEYGEYRLLAARLQEVDIAALHDNNEKMVFFINVYNALTVDSLAQMDTLPSSTLDVDNFWTTTAYNIGSLVYTLDHIEHGILRGNKVHPSTGSPVLAAGDPRLQHSVPQPDPRIHFALNCGAKTCPAVRVYSSSNLEAALEGATKSYLSQEVEVRDGALRLPQVLQWYMADFADDQQGMLRWIQRYVGEAERAAIEALLAPADGSLPAKEVQYFYDWALNTA